MFDFETCRNENRLFQWLDSVVIIRPALSLSRSHWHAINLTIERIRHSFSFSLSRALCFGLCPILLTHTVASLTFTYVWHRRAQSISFSSLFLRSPFLSLSSRDAYKWSAKLPRELLLLVRVFQRMRKKNSLAELFVRSLAVLVCRARARTRTHGYHNHNLPVYMYVIAPMCLFVDGCWDFLFLSRSLSWPVSFTLLIEVDIHMRLYRIYIREQRERENQRERETESASEKDSCAHSH